MNVYDRAVRVAVARLPDVGDDRRADIASTLRELADESPRSRWRELGSVAWLGLRLRSRADTDDRATTSWRQGLHRGGTLLIASGAVDAGGLPAALFVAATWAAARGRVLLAGAAVLPAAALAVTAADADAAAPFALRCVVGLAALAVGATPARDAAALCPWRWMAVVVPAAALATTTSDGVADGVVVALTLGVPLLWLASSRADPRLAVGAAVVLFWRLVAVDLHELGEAAVALPTGPELDLLLVRWVAMATGVVAAVVVARSAIRRAAAV